MTLPPSFSLLPPLSCLQGPKVLFDSSKDCAPEPPVADDGSATPAPSEEASNGALRWEEGKLLIDVGRILCGDYSIWLLTPARDRMRAAGSEGVGLSYGGTGAGDMSDGGGGGGGSAGPRGGPASRRERRHAARFVFHTSMLADAGVSTFSGDDVDVFRSGIDRRAFSLSLVTADVPVETLLDLNLDKAMKRSFLNVQGPAAVVKGAEEFSAHAYTFPDPQLLKTLVSHSGSEHGTAAYCQHWQQFCATQRLLLPLSLLPCRSALSPFRWPPSFLSFTGAALRGLRRDRCGLRPAAGWQRHGPSSRVP